jgi:hypothetical protein
VSCAMPDNYMLRMIGTIMDNGEVEVRTDWSLNNVASIKKFWKRGMKSIQVIPLYN